MSHNYDDLVLGTTGGTNKGCTDYWRLDQDTSASNNAGIANLAKPDASDASGYSATDLLPAANNYGSRSFDGSSNYVTMTYGQLTQGLDFPTSPHSFSVECWMRPEADQSATDVIGLAQKAGCFGIYLAYGKPTFFTQLSGSGRVNCGDSSAVSTSTNYHLVGTFNAASQDLKLYVNGSLVNTVNTGGSTNADACDHTGINFTIGSWDTSVLFFHGEMSNVALYNFVLSSGQVSAHYGYSG